MSTTGVRRTALAAALALGMIACQTSAASPAASSTTAARPTPSPPSTARSSDAEEPLTALRGIAEDANDVVSTVRGRRAADCTTKQLDARERIDKLDARFAELHADRDGYLRAILSGTRMLLQSARACTSCDPVLARQCQRFDGELAELRRAIDE